MMTMASFRVDLEFSYGWCCLGLEHSGQSITIKNHWMNDGFSDLVDALRLILTGTRAVGVPWLHEVAGGHFLDLVADPGGGINIAVHETRHGADADADSPGQIWNAVRGSARFQTRVTTGEFAQACAAGLRRVRTNQVDTTGMIQHWQYSFPQATFEAIERIAEKYGYQPEHAVQGYM